MKCSSYFPFFDTNPIVLAPMAEVNDLSFRKMCRNHGIVLCWTGLIDAHFWVTEKTKRSSVFRTDSLDRPLVCQLLGCDIHELISTAKDLEPFCDFLEINCGCTHNFAKRKQCGYYMIMNEATRERTKSIIDQFCKSVSKPVSIKFRIIEDSEGNPDHNATLAFAQDMIQCGVSFIVLHARQKSFDKKGSPNYNVVKDIARQINIPIIVNGGIKSKHEAQEVIQNTGAVLAMCGQSLLKNPSLFDFIDTQNPYDLSHEYIEIATRNGEPFYLIKKHIFQFFEDFIRENSDFAQKVSDSVKIDDLLRVLNDFNNMVNYEKNS